MTRSSLLLTVLILGAADVAWAERVRLVLDDDTPDGDTTTARVFVFRERAIDPTFTGTVTFSSDSMLTFTPERARIIGGMASTTVSGSGGSGAGLTRTLAADVIGDGGAQGGSAHARMYSNCNSATHNDASWISGCGDLVATSDVRGGDRVTVTFTGSCGVSRICVSGASEVLSTSWSSFGVASGQGTTYPFSGWMVHPSPDPGLCAVAPSGQGGGSAQATFRMSPDAVSRCTADTISGETTFVNGAAAWVDGPNWTSLKMIRVGRNGRAGELPDRGDSSVELSAEPARMKIRHHQRFESHEAAVDPPQATIYGKTAIPLSLKLMTDDPPGPNAGGRVRILAQLANGQSSRAVTIAHLPYERGSSELSETADENGEVGDLFLNVLDLAREFEPGATPPSSVVVIAISGDHAQRLEIPIFDNFSEILRRYVSTPNYVPDGIRSPHRDRFKPPFPNLAVDGLIEVDINLYLAAFHGAGPNVNRAWTCGNYQTFSLVFLNDLRHDSEDFWLLNGIDYGPLQLRTVEHHFVGIYPEGDNYRSERSRILDPWIVQAPVVYTFVEHAALFDFFGNGDTIIPDNQLDPSQPEGGGVLEGSCVNRCRHELVPPPYPNFEPHLRYPFFPDEHAQLGDDLESNRIKSDGCFRKPTDYCSRIGYENNLRLPPYQPELDTGPTRIFIGSPVTWRATTADGRRLGFLPGARITDTPVNELGDAFTNGFTGFTEAGGGVGWMIDISEATFTFELSAYEDGEMSIVIERPDGTLWGAFPKVPIRAGEDYRIPISIAGECSPMERVGDEDVSIVCSGVNTDGASGCSCSGVDRRERSLRWAMLLGLSALIIRACGTRIERASGRRSRSRCPNYRTCRSKRPRRRSGIRRPR